MEASARRDTTTTEDHIRERVPIGTHPPPLILS
jgi:hypothetical protein